MTGTESSTTAVRMRAIASMVAACSVFVFLAGCSPQGGGGTDPSSGTSQGTDGGDTNGDDGEDSGSSDDDNGVINPCTIIPEDALTAALGSPPAPGAKPQAGSGAQVCSIEATSGDARLNIEIYSIAGRDGFEQFRGYKEPVTSLYQELPGVGDDAFAFGSEVTVLIGDRVAVLFLEGLAFDTVPAADRLERTKTLAQIVVDELG